MKIAFLGCCFLLFLGAREVSSQTISSALQWRDFAVLSGSLEEKKNPKGTVFLFVSARCPCSNSHNQEMISLAKTFSEIQFVGVHSNADEPMEVAEKYFRTAGYPFPVVQDHGDKLSNSLSALKTPHAFLLNAKGEVLFRGGVSSSRVFETADRKYLREALEDFMAGKSIRTAEARSLGCMISRGN